MKVDCHTHWGRAWAETCGDDPAKWLAAARRHGITHSIVLPHHGLENAGAIPREHDALARVCANGGGAMLPFCTSCAWEPVEGPAEIRRCLADLGFRGIKFHPWLQGVSVNSQVMDEIAAIAAEFDVPMLFHDGTPPFSLPSQIALLALRHPQTKIILGHGGLFEHYQEAARAVASTDNLWVCLCGPHLEGLRHLVEHCPQDRLLWGSDAGFGLKDPIAYRTALMDQLELDDATNLAIYSNNPRSILKL